MALVKKRRGDDAVLARMLKSSGSIRQMLTVLKPDASIKYHQKLCHKLLHNPKSVETPYGTLVQQLPVDKQDGTGVEMISLIDPFALLYFLAASLPHFAEFFMRHLVGLLNLVLYTDGVSPADSLKFEKGRDYTVWYYTFAETRFGKAP